MKKDENGYIVIETILSFMVFTFFVLSILSLINIVAVQARIHYALTETAQTISMYSYVLDATGVSDILIKSSAKSEAVISEANQVKENLNTIIDILNSDDFRVSDWEKDLNALEDSGGALFETGKRWANDITSDPKGSLQLIMNYGLQEGLSEFAELMLRPLMNHYLSNGDISGDEFLKRFHVTGGVESLVFHSFDLLDLSSTGDTNTRLLDANGNVKLVVEYDIDYTFGALPLPFQRDNKTGRFYLHVTQEAMTKAWLGGSGDGYKG